MMIMPLIRPITDLRNTGEISEMCHQIDEPVFITKNGYGDLVIMSIENYERQLARAEIYTKLAEAEKQIADGVPLLDIDDVFANLRGKYAK
jgi:PHD/YefM family antitoxin component YafN of YafNO toxin-antitoxin module